MNGDGSNEQQTSLTQPTTAIWNPQDDDDGEETWDEMDLADIERQARLDEGDWLAETLRQRQEN